MPTMLLKWLSNGAWVKSPGNHFSRIILLFLSDGIRRLRLPFEWPDNEPNILCIAKIAVRPVGYHHQLISKADKGNYMDDHPDKPGKKS